MARNYEEVLSEAIEDSVEEREKALNFCNSPEATNNEIYKRLYKDSLEGSVLMSAKRLLDIAKGEEKPELRKKFGDFSILIYKKRKEIVDFWNKSILSADEEED